MAACENILQDERVNPSLISVFSALDAGTTQEGGKIAPNAMSPKEWKIFTIWRAEDIDLRKTYTQKTVVIAPNGVEFGSGSDEFTLQSRSHWIKVGVNGMPVGVEGDVVIRTWLELAGKKATDVYTTEINIRHRK